MNFERITPCGERCHCDHYNHSTETWPLYYCKCGAEFYRPMFAIFGENVLIEPYKTVLHGDSECILAICIEKQEET
jgi:NAD-dependent SIR2 family protein deacetylase